MAAAGGHRCKDRRQQRFAHIIRNAGVTVAGLRNIDRELHRLFLPLVYFDPAGWPDPAHREWSCLEPRGTRGTRAAGTALALIPDAAD